MPTSLEHVLEQWALAWSSSDAETLLPLFADSVVYEDVTFGAVNHGKNALRDFATGLFAACADLKFELKSRFAAADGKSGAMEWIMRGRQTRDLPGLPATNKPFEVRGGDSRRVYRRKDQSQLRLLGSCDLPEAGRSHQVSRGCRHGARGAAPFVDGCAALTAPRRAPVPSSWFRLPGQTTPAEFSRNPEPETLNPKPETRNPKPNGFGSCPRRPSSFVLV